MLDIFDSIGMCYQKVARLLAVLDGTFAEVHPAIFIQQELDEKVLEEKCTLSERLSEVLEDLETCSGTTYLQPREEVAQVLQDELKFLPIEVQTYLVQAARTHLTLVRKNFLLLGRRQENEFHKELATKAELILGLLAEN